MGLTMEMRKGFAREKAKRYRQGSKKKKGQLIEEYMELVGCTRHHAAWTLRCWGITVWEQHAGRPVKIVVGRRRSRQRTARIYDQQTVAALTKLWRHFGYLCGKRLAATLRLWLPHYEGWNARSKRKIALTPEVRAKLLRISPATIDRLLRVEKRKLLLRGLSHTKKPTGTLMLQIPIHTFSEWQNVPVGSLGMDLVGHDGGSAQGEFAYTLLATDRCTQWTRCARCPTRLRSGCSSNSWWCAACSPSSCWESTRITAENSSTPICSATASSSRSTSRAPARIARTTTTSLSRRTSTWCANMSARPATTPPKRSHCSTSCTTGCG